MKKDKIKADTGGKLDIAGVEGQEEATETVNEAGEEIVGFNLKGDEEEGYVLPEPMPGQSMFF